MVVGASTHPGFKHPTNMISCLAILGFYLALLASIKP